MQATSHRWKRQRFLIPALLVPLVIPLFTVPTPLRAATLGDIKPEASTNAFARQPAQVSDFCWQEAA